MFEVVLNDKSLKGITDYTKRLNIITKDLFQVSFSASSQGSFCPHWSEVVGPNHHSDSGLLYQPRAESKKYFMLF